MNSQLNQFYQNKKVLITGHTGFKGAWLSLILKYFGADVNGYALKPHTNPNLYTEAEIGNCMNSYIGDIRDIDYLKKILLDIKPDIIIHMAAQAIVRDSYKNPVETYSVNVMGTVSLLETIRQTGTVKALVNVTSDKCYHNNEWHWGYRETDRLGGYDPYSNSKACSELVTESFRNSFFNPENYEIHGVAVASARAGNVIGGGDWATDRLIPDFLRGIKQGETIKIRSPYSHRPWQHVLEPLYGYLLLAKELYLNGPRFSGAWNFGPDDSNIRDVEWIISTLCELWGGDARFEIDKNPHPHEASYLKLDCSKAKNELGWIPAWDIYTTLKAITTWNKAYINGENMRVISEDQIKKYFKTIK